MPLVAKIGLNHDTSLTLSLESAITDILNVVFLFVLLDAQREGFLDFKEALTSLAGKFSVGIVLGFLIGVLWLRLLMPLRSEEFTYVSTIAVLMGSFEASELLGGSGVLTALILGMVLGNDEEIGRILRFRTEGIKEVKTFLVHFQKEMAFLMRSFFFVFVGLIYNPSIFPPILGLAYSVAILGINLGLRYVSTFLSTIRSEMKPDRLAMTLMSGQGLAHAALSLVPLQAGLPNPFLYIAVVTDVVILTNVITSISAAYLRSCLNSKAIARQPELAARGARLSAPVRPPEHGYTA